MLGHRRVEGGLPPTSEVTKATRRKCVDLLREALGLPALRLDGGEIPVQPAPEAATLSARSLSLYVPGDTYKHLTGDEWDRSTRYNYGSYSNAAGWADA